MTIKPYGAQASDQPLESMDITRRAAGAHDMQIDVAYCDGHLSPIRVRSSPMP